MIRIHNGDQPVIPRHQLPRLQLGSIFLCNDVLPVADPCSHAIEWPLQAFFEWGEEEPPDVIRHCFLILIEILDLSIGLVLQFVGPLLIILSVAIRFSWMPLEGNTGTCVQSSSGLAAK